jgi:hypothetical protein
VSDFQYNTVPVTNGAALDASYKSNLAGGMAPGDAAYVAISGALHIAN